MKKFWIIFGVGPKVQLADLAGKAKFRHYMKQLLLGVLVLGLLQGCAAIGGGDRTIIRAATSDASIASMFPFLLTSSGNAEDRALVVDGRGSAIFPTTKNHEQSKRLERFDRYMRAKYGSVAYEGAMLSLTTRDLGKMPPLAPEIAATLRQEIVKILNDTKLSEEQRRARVQELQAALLNSPEAAYSTTLQRIDPISGAEIYHYFPRIQMNLHADLLSNSLSDRFSQIIMYVELPEDAVRNGVRFVDFSPKGSDIAEFSRGQFKETAQLLAKGTIGKTGGSSGTDVVGDSTQVDTSGFSLGGDLSFTSTEEFTRQLNDALEKRTAGIVNDGRALLVQYRSIRQLRVGGTYSFDIMLEIPADASQTANSSYYQLLPAVTEIEPKIVLIGVVRHVYDKGEAGFFQRVPEIENDDVFEQVTLHTPSANLWAFNNVPWIRPYVPKPAPVHILHVVANHESARYFVKRRSDNKILATGKGLEQKLQTPIPASGPSIQAEIEFQPVVIADQQGGKILLNPTPTNFRFDIDAQNTAESVSVTYQ